MILMRIIVNESLILITNLGEIFWHGRDWVIALWGVWSGVGPFSLAFYFKSCFRRVKSPELGLVCLDCENFILHSDHFLKVRKSVKSQNTSSSSLLSSEIEGGAAACNLSVTKIRVVRLLVSTFKRNWLLKSNNTARNINTPGRAVFRSGVCTLDSVLLVYYKLRFGVRAAW